MRTLSLLAVLCLAAAKLAISARHDINRYAVKRHVHELADAYDFVIVGGGTAGLTIADRLTEAFPEKNLLVVEYGQVEYAPGTWDPPKVVWGETGGGAGTWQLRSTPSPELNNQTAFVIVGKTVGGSSAVNGMVFDRGSRHDYDAWDKLQDDTHDRPRWNWNTLYPFFRKSTTFTVPPLEVAKKHNYTWDLSAWGNSTPIYASMPPFQWSDHQTVRDAWIEMGIPNMKECADGNKENLCWVPCSADPIMMRRSYSGLGHYAHVSNRTNYHLLVKHQGVRLVYPGGNPTAGPPIVEIRSVENGTLSNVTARADVILSAGVFGSTAVLQRSGIGPATFLKNLNIPVVLDLPGVGSNLHDHSGPVVSWDYETTPDFHGPMPSDLLNTTFTAWATAAFNETPAQGPYTLAMSNSAIWISLVNMTADAPAIISRIRSLATSNGTLYLPPEYGSDPTLLAGYRAQLSVLAELLGNAHAPSLESAIATGTRLAACALHPLSRGTVRLNGTDRLSSPILDYRSASNPIDMTLHLVHLRYLRKTVHTETLRGLTAVEVAPGVDLQTDEQLIKYIRAQTTQSYMHPCCTTAMLPLSQGGVVGPDLRVHGASGLRIVDAGIYPILPSAHLSATTYAVAERAASIFIEQWRR